jgi:MFS family permease
MSAIPAPADRNAGLVQGIVLLLPVTLSVMGIAILVPVMPQLMAHFADVPGHQYLIQGGVLTMPALCITLFSPLAGWLADRLGRRRILIAAIVVYAAFGIAPVFLDNLFAIIATRVGVGLCEAVIMTVSTTLISDYYDGHRREQWLASQTAVASLSSLLLIYLGGVLGASHGWRGPFGVYLVSLVFAAGIWLYTWEPRSDRSSPVVDRKTEFPWARLSGICAITLFASVMFYTIQTQSSLALTHLGVTDPERIGFFTMLASLGIPLGTFVFRGLARLPIGVLIGLEFALIGAGFVFMGRASTPNGFVIAAAFNQIGCGMVLPTLLTWATRGLAFEIRGRGNGVWQGTFAVGQFLSGVVVTFLGETSGGLLPAFIILGVSNIVAAVLAFGGHVRARALRNTGMTSRQSS